MDPETILFCKNIGTYQGQLTKRRGYVIEEVNSDNVRIKNDQNKLKWYSKFYFDLEKEPEIISVILDDKMEDLTCDLVEVTIEFSNKEKYWTSFTTPEYLKNLLIGQSHISTQKLIILSELIENKIKEIVFELDAHNELIECCNKCQK
ncbi:hypothetical protein D3C71_493550 [compost metagenome]